MQGLTCFDSKMASAEGTDADIDYEQLQRSINEAFRQSIEQLVSNLANAANDSATKVLLAVKDKPKPPPTPKPVATGVRPRLLLLPALVVTLLIVPVLGIFLPVGATRLPLSSDHNVCAHMTSAVRACLEQPACRSNASFVHLCRSSTMQPKHVRTSSPYVSTIVHFTSCQVQCLMHG